MQCRRSASSPALGSARTDDHALSRLWQRQTQVLSAVYCICLTLVTCVTVGLPPLVLADPVEVNIVAHQDDDDFFLQPDIYHALEQHYTQVTVYLTAGNVLADDYYYMVERELGAMNANAEMALGVSGQPLGTNPGTVHWQTAQERYGGEKVTTAHCIEFPKVHLLFLRLPAAASIDGREITRNLAGQHVQGIPTLGELYTHTQPQVVTVDKLTTYTQASLTAVLAAILETWHPEIIRTQDWRKPPTQSGDHADHYYGALFARDALHLYRTRHPDANPQYWVYGGYDIYNDANALLVNPQDRRIKEWLSYYYSLYDFHMQVPADTKSRTAYTRPPQYTMADWLTSLGLDPNNPGYPRAFPYGAGGDMYHERATAQPLP